MEGRGRGGAGAGPAQGRTVSFLVWVYSVGKTLDPHERRCWEGFGQ